jgi:hypothetical protein
MIPAHEPTIDGAALVDALEAKLGVQLAGTPSAPTVANLHDVSAVYSGASTNERLVAVVFDSPAATVQLVGGNGVHHVSGVGQLLRHDNVVVIYQHDVGTLSRWNLVRSVVRAAPPV